MPLHRHPITHLWIAHNDGLGVRSKGLAANRPCFANDGHFTLTAHLEHRLGGWFIGQNGAQLPRHHRHGYADARHVHPAFQNGVPAGEIRQHHHFKHRAAGNACAIGRFHFILRAAIVAKRHIVAAGALPLRHHHRAEALFWTQRIQSIEGNFAVWPQCGHAAVEKGQAGAGKRAGAHAAAHIHAAQVVHLLPITAWILHRHNTLQIAKNGRCWPSLQRFRQHRQVRLETRFIIRHDGYLGGLIRRRIRSFSRRGIGYRGVLNRFITAKQPLKNGNALIPFAVFALRRTSLIPFSHRRGSVLVPRQQAAHK